MMPDESQVHSTEFESLDPIHYKNEVCVDPALWLAAWRDMAGFLCLGGSAPREQKAQRFKAP